MISFTWMGQPFTFDEERLSVSEAQQLKKACGLTVRQFMVGLREYDADALVALIRLAKVRAGGYPRVENVLLPDFDLFADLIVEPAASNGEAGPVPTGGADDQTSTAPPSKTSTPTSTGRGGSGRSRSTSGTPPPRSTR